MSAAKRPAYCSICRSAASPCLCLQESERVREAEFVSLGGRLTLSAAWHDAFQAARDEPPMTPAQLVVYADALEQGYEPAEAELIARQEES